MSQAVAVPVNYRAQNASPEAIANDVERACEVGLNYVRHIATALGRSPSMGPSAVADLDILEIGPGPNLGPALVLACGGARITLVDRFAVRWDDNYHPRVLNAMAERMALIPGASPEPILRVLKAGAFTSETLSVRECAAEDLLQLPAESADAVISNAVLEHVADVPRAFAGFAHVTRPGGMGLHQVDFRDHRNFSKPLEYMTMSKSDFEQLFKRSHAECGNRWRPRQMGAAFEAAGMQVRQFHPNIYADAAYVADIKTRLHPDVCPVDDMELQIVSGHYVTVRP